MQNALLAVDRFSTWVGKAAAWTAVALTVLISVEVFSRYVLNKPHGWVLDAQIMLYGTLFMTLGKELPEDPTPADLGRALSASVAALKARGKAEVGNKTMLDVLAPVAAHLESGGASFDSIRALAADSARATIPMKAIRGRACNKPCRCTSPRHTGCPRRMSHRPDSPSAAQTSMNRPSRSAAPAAIANSASGSHVKTG